MLSMVPKLRAYRRELSRSDLGMPFLKGYTPTDPEERSQVRVLMTNACGICFVASRSKSRTLVRGEQS